ncbi:fungal-specific transcription factor domain-containing protein [Epithele typhae]|uniref:fungal-specific transcription factor domain-containing protein n=1 Tax=Epithele typhae TaxID=378194 RepID=UPI0020078966|nr:fungal-specific transcription factor domain-containing protein [Epithele typhae]KAH9926296.1 fungal-specific transcription factor domain-containing protein [Epithele typhae]
MSSGEEDIGSSKKRKLQRACDHCRRKKIKCDGPQMPDNRCTRCVTRKMDCTYNEAMQRSTYPSSYVEGLENRLERVEALLNKLCPDDAVQLDEHSPPDASKASKTPTLEISEALSNMPPISTPNEGTGGQSSDDEYGEAGLTEADYHKRLLSVDVPSYRFHGKSSALVLIHNAMHMMSKVMGPGPAPGEPGHQTVGQYHHHPWMRRLIEDRLPPFKAEDFPPKDLLGTLIDAYFREVNDFNPVLHEPSFKRSIIQGLHLRRGGLGAVVLLVCAIAARFVDDPRVLLPGTTELASAGWAWYDKVDRVRLLPVAPVELYDIQIYALMATFLWSTATPQAAFSVASAGIRLAVDIGANRKMMYNSPPTIEEELYKRAFWSLVAQDWMMAYGLGRPPTIHDEDIDVGLPVECDDEYWLDELGKPSFKQPAGKPSKVAAFNCYIRLTQILLFAIRTIYAVTKVRMQATRADPNWEQRVVAELDSSLNKWVDSLPAHLRWDPERTDTIFLTQSGFLFANYYHFQIAVHRPFMRPTPNGGPRAFPSHIICMNAARSAVHVLDLIHKKTGKVHYGCAGHATIAGTILMLNVWMERMSDRQIAGSSRDLVSVQKCIELLDHLRHVGGAAEVLRDVLKMQLSAAKRPYTKPSPSTPLVVNTSEAEAKQIVVHYNNRGPEDPESPSALEYTAAAASPVPAWAPQAKGTRQQQQGGPAQDQRSGFQATAPGPGPASHGDGGEPSSLAATVPTPAVSEGVPDGFGDVAAAPFGFLDGTLGESAFPPDAFRVQMPSGRTEAMPIPLAPGQDFGMDFPGQGEPVEAAAMDFAFVDDMMTMFTTQQTGAFGWNEWAVMTNLSMGLDQGFMNVEPSQNTPNDTSGPGPSS